MSNSKFIGLDGMRGIAALFVFVRHTSEFWVASTRSPVALIKPFLFLGVVSYPLYALHAPINEFFQHFYKDFIIEHQPVSGIILLAVLLPTCALIVKLIDEPSRKILSRFFLKR